MKFFLTVTKKTTIKTGEMNGIKWNKTYTHCEDDKGNNFIVVVKNTDLSLDAGVSIEIESLNEYENLQKSVMLYWTGTGKFRKQVVAYESYILEINAKPDVKFNAFRINNISKK